MLRNPSPKQGRHRGRADVEAGDEPEDREQDQEEPIAGDDEPGSDQQGDEPDDERLQGHDSMPPSVVEGMLAPASMPGQPRRHTCQLLAIAADTIGRVTQPIDVSLAVARRFLVLRHLLAPPRSLPAGPASVMAVVERLGSLQFDPLEVAGRNHDLVLLARIAGYRRDVDRRAAVRGRGGCTRRTTRASSLVPTAELPWYRVTWDRARASTRGRHVRRARARSSRSCSSGSGATVRCPRPTSSRARRSTGTGGRRTRSGRSSRRSPRRASSGSPGATATAGSTTSSERLFPAELLAERPARATSSAATSSCRATERTACSDAAGSAELWLGTAPDVSRPGRRRRDATELLAELVEAGALVPVAVEGITGERLRPRRGAADPGRRPSARSRRRRRPGAAAAGPGVAFLAPLDPFVWDRDFLRALYGFDYVWEVYVPAPKRRWGYYVLPILFGDRLVGRIEPRIDRKASTLRVLGLWWETGFDPLAATGFIEAFRGGRSRPTVRSAG